MNAKQILAAAKPVMPVVVLDTLDQALPLANALYNGGIKVIEITLRSECALAAIKLLKDEMPSDCYIGAGTVLNSQQFNEVVEAGADFVISPGIIDELLITARDSSTPMIPGVSTPSEAMKAMSYGFKTLKLFPAEQSGGVAMLKALSGPLADIKFCPTGGVNPESAKEYLKLDNVLCVGGSWIAPSNKIKTRDWNEITKIARTTVSQTY